ncbi:hypothetical protein Oweho_1148 [Owenweeksia hongkongensis DSM 17368]|uniref:Uncharacterized protein n=1 Tax=Owenweeksia hongkongensis (strain DSM 17368 / CIP 108786 / JCM 12287 / NRRL B-23963 / UST20020801) TaxID=926562 RepID=G8R5A8_OWEHD|nr:hypothetical protein [Owenweeksia hongkongensis]AEV32153.1 hypothetical protein Oweho_1148 [Owenweeksia hongkongensis DSM 17368]
MISKANLKKTIDDLPDRFSLEELMEKVILLDKIERGYKQSEAGQVVVESEVEEEMAKWYC